MDLDAIANFVRQLRHNDVDVRVSIHVFLDRDEAHHQKQLDQMATRVRRATRKVKRISDALSPTERTD